MADISLVLQGPTEIWRSNAIDTPDPLDPGHLNHIDTEIVSLNLTGGGVVLRAGDGVGNGLNDGPLNSPGAIDEQVADDSLADSFFDVFFEIEFNGLTLHNQEALRIEAVIDRIPPIGIPYNHPIPDPISLYDDGGVERARLVNASHTPTPEPTSIIVWSLLGLTCAGGGWRNRRRSA